MGILANENAISSNGYQIANSLRFQSASSQYLSRTPASATNRTTWTWSGWVKRGALTASDVLDLFSARTADSDYTRLFFDNSTGYLQYLNVAANAQAGLLATTQLFRDPSSWYHIILAVDTTQVTASNRIKLYVNGSQVTAFTSTGYANQNTTTYINSTASHYIGYYGAYSRYFDGYLAEVNFIDGQALAPSSFGTTDTTSGQWVAKKYTGTYGTNGFYLPFSNGTSTTTLGADSSGNSNNWTLTNFTRSAGVSDCWMYDVPSGNGGASGTQPSSNYCVMNPLSKIGTATTSNANLAVSLTGSATGSLINGSIIVSSGKWYWEGKFNTGADAFIGWNRVDLQTGTGNAFQQAGSLIYFSTNGNLYSNGNGGAAYGASYASTDIIGCALNLDTNQATFYKNNVAQATVSITAGNYAACFTVGGTSTTNTANFGQRAFTYTPPSGFKALCTANLPVATIKQGNKYMDATLYTGNGTTQSIANASSFKPDLVWTKGRSFASTNWLTDSVRGATKILTSNATDAEATNAGSVTSFNAGGFSVGATGDFNSSGQTFVGWQWQAGQGTTSSNTNGSITSTTSVNATAGFSIVTFTATGANSTVGHGLGVAPKMVITKSRNNTFVWYTWHTALAGNEYLELSTTVAKGTSTGLWNSTIPTSSVLSFGTSYPSGTNLVAYCFAEIAGFSKFGSYTGNGATYPSGVFVYTGFTPRFLLIKMSGRAGTYWELRDTARSPYNSSTVRLDANNSNAEESSNQIDIMSNGFVVTGADAGINGNGDTYIYAAFASNPFANSNAH